MNDQQQQVPDAALLRHLLTLRFMLGDATRWASQGGPERLTTAVILLDGVVERAVNLVAGEVGISVGPRDDAVQVADKVRAARPAWKPPAWRDIVDLHRARNSAQHAGQRPHPDDIAPWTNAVGAFVRDVVETHLGLALDRLALTDAVRDEDLRAQLTMSAAALDAGDPESSVARSLKAVDLAESRWAAMLQAPRSGWQSMQRVPFGLERYRLLGSPRDPVERVAADVDGLKREVRLSTFAQDPADVAWFARLRTEAALVNLEDAQRALAFATSWVLGYESAGAGYTHDRRDRAARDARHVRTGDGPARLGALRGAAATLRGTSISVQLEDVPAPDQFDAWRAVVRRLCTELNDGTPLRGEVEADGTATLEAEDDRIEHDLRILSEALSRADDQIAADWDADSRRQQQMAAAVRAFAEEFADLGDVPGWVERVDLEPMGVEGSGVSVRVTDRYSWLSGWRPAQDAPDLTSLLREDPRVETASVVESGWIQFTPTLGPAAVHELLWAATPPIREHEEQLQLREGLYAERERIVHAKVEEVLRSLADS